MRVTRTRDLDPLPQKFVTSLCVVIVLDGALVLARVRSVERHCRYARNIPVITPEAVATPLPLQRSTHTLQRLL
jgi:hypothetical protein